jgi:site-specific DNA-methyltransferase (adenine-specific)
MATATSRAAAAGIARDPTHLAAFTKAVNARLDRDGVVVLEPVSAEVSLPLLAAIDLTPGCVMLDPWYNKGVGGERTDYLPFIATRLRDAAAIAPHVYLWGFPEIVASFVERLPAPLTLQAWLTWFYKNNPSVIRGWRSAQMTCLHLTRPDARLHPEAFLNEAQLAKQAAGKLRYVPGPPSVIESPLLVGFVGRSEQTGHPAQKPERVFEPLLQMATVAGDVVVDPMCGSGTTGAVARAIGRRAVLADEADEYVTLTESRLGITRIALPPH